MENLVSNIDNRKIECGCGDPKCKIGLNMDTTETGDILLLTDKFGNEHVMHLSKRNVSDLQDYLIDVKRNM